MSSAVSTVSAATSEMDHDTQPLHRTHFNDSNNGSHVDTEVKPKKRMKVIDEKVSELDVPLPMWRKICFAIGGTPYQMSGTVIGFFLNIFLLEVALLEPKYISIILFSGKAWDAITDPTIGLLVQKTNTRWGKMRPWILFSAPLACVAYFMLFYVPWDIVQDKDGKETIDASGEAKLAFYFCFFCLFEGLVSCLHVPYTSMTMYVATRQKDRDSITAIRMGCEAMGVLIAVVVQGMFVSSTRCTGTEVDSGHTDNSTITTQLEAYVHGSTVVIAIYMLCCLVCFFGSEEKKGVIEDKPEHHLGFFASLKLVMTFKPYVWASLTFLLFSMAIQIVQGNIALYTTHTLKMGDDLTFFILVLLVVSIAAMPFWQLMLLKFGKKTIYAAGMVLFIPILMTNLYIPAEPDFKPLYYVLMAVAGMSISVALLLPWSVLPDVIDLYMLEKNARHDALFYSFYVFFNKLSVGIALAISQVALDVGGYVSGECEQPDSVSDMMRYLVTPGPVVLTVLALVCLWFYPIDEDLRRRIKSRLTDYEKKVESAERLDQDSKSYESIRRIDDLSTDI